MSDLTREEIQSACEAVPGWRWDADIDCAYDLHDLPRFDLRACNGDLEQTEATIDALALLEAWCSVHPDREAQLFINRDKPGLILIPEEGMDYAIAEEGPLRIAAVRAVNQWKTREVTP